MALDIHIYQVPVSRMRELSSLWKPTKTRGLRYRSHYAFRANALRAGLTRIQRWDAIEASLLEQHAQKVRTVSMLVSAQEPSDLWVRSVNRITKVSFFNQQETSETTNLRPGNLVFRWQVLPQTDGTYRLMGVPALALTISSRIPELAERMRSQETTFDAAAFTAPMGPGDVLILGPEAYHGDTSTLGGLLFSETEDVLFVDRLQPTLPHAEPAIQLFILICSQVKTPGS
jgi:hypothetical protein